MSSLFCGTDRISLKKMPFKPQEWPFKLQKWAFRVFKLRSLRGWDLQGSKLKGIFTSEKQGNVLHQDFALSIESKILNRVLTKYMWACTCPLLRTGSAPQRNWLPEQSQPHDCALCQQPQRSREHTGREKKQLSFDEASCLAAKCHATMLRESASQLPNWKSSRRDFLSVPLPKGPSRTKNTMG